MACFFFFSYPVFWKRFVDTVLISSEAYPRWNKAYTSIGLRGTGGYLTGSWKIDKWALFFTRKWQVVPYVMWRHAEGCSLSSPLCVSRFFFSSFFLTPLLFNQDSEHLNDQKFCNMAVCPRAVKFGRICFSKWERETWTMHIHYRPVRAHTHTHAHPHTHLFTSPAFSRQANGSRCTQTVEPGRKVKECAPQRRCSQSHSCPDPAAIRSEGKRPQYFYSTFTHSSAMKYKVKQPFIIQCFPGNNKVNKSTFEV